MTTSAEKSQRNHSNASLPNNSMAGGGVAGSDSADADAGVGNVPNSITKTDSEEDAWSSNGYNYINPFVHRVQIDNGIDMAKNLFYLQIYVLTVLLLPIRVVGCMLTLISAWMFACIGLYGLTLDDLNEKPLSGWRKQVQRVAAVIMRGFYASGTFHHITLKGERAHPKEAPILVVAPHSSYADSVVVVVCGPPSIVAKRDTSEIPFLGKIINFSQPIYVQREDPNSRQNTIRQIVSRAHSEDEWPQVVIFPEGTCTNRSALIKFKPGAFYPGVPIQPVLLKYPNKYDTFTWTWDGPGVLRLLWMTMAQFYNHCEVEFLPVYRPSKAEKADANLYAKNVREVMAKALGVPTSEYSYEDVIMMNRARDMKIPFPGDIIEIERNLYVLGLTASDRDYELAAQFLSMSNADKLDIFTFSESLKVDAKDPHLHQLFSLLDHRKIYTVSMKSFLLCSLFCKLKNDEVIHFLRAVTNLYAESVQSISRQSFTRIMRHSMKLTAPEKCDALFFAIDDTNKGFITFDDFERHTKELPQYKFLYKKPERIRRIYDKN